MRVDSDGSSNAADISGATSKTYVLVAADEGKKVKVRVAFQDDLGNAESRTSDAFPSTATVAAADGTAPTVTANATGYFTSAAATTALAGPLKSGADIYTKVTFSEDMKHVKSDAAAARPEIFHRIGSTDTQYDIVDNADALATGDCKPAAASDTDVYVCRYTVGGSDNGAFRVKVGTASVDKMNNALAAVYTHTATLTLDNTAPTVTSATGYYSDAALSSALTGAVKGGTSVYTKVTFSEDMKHVKDDGTDARPELFRRIGSTDVQYDILDNGDTLSSGDCRPNHASETDEYVCLYTVDTSDSGTFTVKAGTGSVDKADNALAAVYTHAATLTLDNTAPAKPSALALASGTASPGNDATPDIEVTVGESGGTVTLHSDSACANAASAATDVTDTQSPFKVTVTATALTSDGSVTFHAKHTDAATNASACSTASVAYIYDGTDPGIAFPDGVTPTAGTAAAITLTDATAKVAKHAVVEVAGTATDATGCDDPSGDSLTLTTVSPAASPKTVSYTPVTATKKICVYAEDAAGNSDSELWTTPIAAADTTGPSVSGAPAITSAAGTYTKDDDIEVTVTFDEAIAVTGAPELKLRVGTGAGSEKSAGCAAHADDDTKLVCTYTVASGDEDTDGVSVEANKLSRPGSATIKDAQGNDATLTHQALAAQSAHKVDAVAPTVTQASTGYFSDADATTALAGPVKGGVNVYTKVTFSEDMKHVKSDAAAARPELFHRIGSTDTQYDILDNGDTLASGDCKPADASDTDVYVCLYTVGLVGQRRVRGEGRQGERGQGGQRAGERVHPHRDADPRHHEARHRVPVEPGQAAGGGGVHDHAHGRGREDQEIRRDHGRRQLGRGDGLRHRHRDRHRQPDLARHARRLGRLRLHRPGGSSGKKVCPYAEDAAGNIKSALWSAAAQAAPTGPAVSSIAITSSVPSNQNGHYRFGDAIEVTVTFDKALTVTGTPKLKIKVGTAEKEASCAKKGTTGDDAKTLVCTYTVAEGDADANGIAVEAGKLTGTITDGTMAANLTYTAIADSSGHKVDGVRPTVTQASTGYFGNAAATTALTGPQKSATDIYTKVTFSEDMKHVKSDAAAARPELFRRIGSADTQYDILDNGDTLANGDCKPSHATSTNVYVCLYTVGSSVNGRSGRRPARTARTRRATRWRTPTPTPRR